MQAVGNLQQPTSLKIEETEKGVLQIDLPPLHYGQLEVLWSEARHKVVACGRRWGKSELGCYIALIEASKDPMSAEPFIIWVVAPTYAQAMINWRKFSRIAKSTIRDKNKGEKYMELANDTQVWFKTASDPDNLRGEGLNYVIKDEAAMIKRTAHEDAIRPALADKRGGSLSLSTPKGKNYFHEEFLKGVDPLNNKYDAWSFPTWDNPIIDLEEIKDTYTGMTELVYQQEIEARFLEDIGAVFRGVDKNVKGELREAVEGGEYVIGCDLAKHQDFTVLAVVDSKNHVVFWDRFNKIDWPFQKQRIISVAKRYNNAALVIDATGLGDPIYDDLKRQGLNVTPFKFTSSTKKDLIENLSLRIEQGEVTYPEIPELINELKIFGYEMRESGTIKYSAPVGYHDDCVIGLALAMWGMKNRVRIGKPLRNPFSQRGAPRRF